MNIEKQVQKAMRRGFDSVFVFHPTSDSFTLAADRRQQDRNRLNGDFEKVANHFSVKLRNTWENLDKQK